MGGPAHMRKVSRTNEAPSEGGRERAGVNGSAKTRKSAATRERILSAALALVSERGNTSFQMSDVAEYCGMSKGALYYYFADKDGIVRELVARDSEALVWSMEEAVSQDVPAKENLRTLCAVAVRHLRVGVSFLPALLSSALDARIASSVGVESRFSRVFCVIEEQLKRGIDEGVIRDDVDLRLASASVCGSFLIATIEELGKQGSSLDEEQLADRLVDLVLAGLCPRDAR